MEEESEVNMEEREVSSSVGGSEIKDLTVLISLSMTELEGLRLMGSSISLKLLRGEEGLVLLVEVGEALVGVVGGGLGGGVEGGEVVGRGGLGVEVVGRVGGLAFLGLARDSFFLGLVSPRTVALPPVLLWLLGPVCKTICLWVWVLDLVWIGALFMMVVLSRAWRVGIAG